MWSIRGLNQGIFISSSKGSTAVVDYCTVLYFDSIIVLGDHLSKTERWSFNTGEFWGVAKVVS